MSLITKSFFINVFRFVSKTILATTVVMSVLMVFTGIFLFMIVIFIAAVQSNIESPIVDTNKYVTKNIEGNAQSSNKILSIRINGIILSNPDESGGFFDLVSNQATYGYQIKDMLLKAANDSEIKAVLLEINSPGGTVTGSQAIYDGIKAFKKGSHKPVFAHIQGLSASGAVWSSVAADKIYADTGSLIGSIGVISGPFKYYNKVLSESGSLFSDGVVTQNGIETFNITSGKYKDFGNPYRKMSEEELKTMQLGLDNTYREFIRLVSTERRISEDRIRNVIKALVYDNLQAKDLGLIDGTENREAVIDSVLRQAKIERNDYQIVRMRPKIGKLESLLEITTSIFPKQAAEKRMNIFQNACISTHKVMAYYGDMNSLCR